MKAPRFISFWFRNLLLERFKKERQVCARQQYDEMQSEPKPKADSGAVDRSGEASAAASLVAAPPAGGHLQPA